jgi:hypothetical protein
VIPIHCEISLKLRLRRIGKAFTRVCGPTCVACAVEASTTRDIRWSRASAAGLCGLGSLPVLSYTLAGLRAYSVGVRPDAELASKAGDVDLQGELIEDSASSGSL